MVLVIPLHTVKDETVGDIVQTYLSDTNKVHPRQLDSYIVSNPNKVLLLLDAFDEMNANLSDLYYIIEILLMKRLKSCTVLVTARPWTADLIRQTPTLRKAYAFVFVEGFDKANLSTYITKFFCDNKALAHDLIHFIEDNDVIRENMAPFPIYTAMLCVMWRELEEDRRKAMDQLQTFSQLFTEMMKFLCDHFRAKGISCRGDLTVEECLVEIGRVAFQGLIERRMTFSERNFSNTLDMETGCLVGLLSRQQKGMRRIERKRGIHTSECSVSFPHKLFQEYVAAIYVASLFSTDNYRFEDLMKGTIIPNLHEFRYLLYFTLSQGKDITMNVMGYIKHFMGRELNEDDGELRKDLEEDIVDIMYESQHPEVASLVWKELFSSQKELKLENQSAHTISGYMFLMRQCHLVTAMISLNHKGACRCVQNKNVKLGVIFLIQRGS